MTEHSHPSYPWLTLFFSGLSVISNKLSTINLSAIDVKLIAPLAHTAAFISACIAITLGSLTLYERYLKWKKDRKPNKK